MGNMSKYTAVLTFSLEYLTIVVVEFDCGSKYLLMVLTRILILNDT